MRVRYFAWLRQRLGTEAEEVELPAGITRAGDVLPWLRTLSARHEAALDEAHAIGIAVNHVRARPDDPVSDADEVALFPPVTGG
jgi:molybdopterin synthase sulfur carrier subunit